MGLVMSRFYDRLFVRDTRILMLGLDAAGKTTLVYKLKLNEIVTTIPARADRAVRATRRAPARVQCDTARSPGLRYARRADDRLQRREPRLPQPQHDHLGCGRPGQDSRSLCAAPPARARPRAPVKSRGRRHGLRALRRAEAHPRLNPRARPWPLARAGRHYFSGTDALIFVVDSNDRDRFGEAREELFKVLNDADMVDPVVLIYANKMDLPGAATASAITHALGLHELKHTWYIQPSSAVTGDGIAEGLEWLSARIKAMPVKQRP
jgi:GTPase SAR1 family protein